MSGSYLVIRRVMVGPLFVNVAYDPSNHLVYLIQAAQPEATSALLDSPFLLQHRGYDLLDEEQFAVLEAPEGTPLALLAPTMREDQALEAVGALAEALAALERTGLMPLPMEVSGRVLVLDQTQQWRFNFIAACLTPGAGKETYPGAVTVVGQVCDNLLQLPRLKKSARLRALVTHIAANPHLSITELLLFYGNLTAARGRKMQIRISPRVAAVAAAVMVLPVLGYGVLRFLASPGVQVAKAAQTTPDTAAVETPPTADVTPADQGAEVDLPRFPEEQDDTPKHIRPQDPGTLEPEAPVEEPGEAPGPTPPPKPKPKPKPPAKPPQTATMLPGPYCEGWGAQPIGGTRYLVINGATICTAHIWTTGGTFISMDALRVVANVEGVQLQPNEFVRASNQTWIRLSQETMRRFGLELHVVDSTRIVMAR